MRRSPFKPDCFVTPVHGKHSACKTTLGVVLTCALLLGAAGGCTANETQSEATPPARTTAPENGVEKDTAPVRPQPARKVTMDEKNKHSKSTPPGNMKHSVPPDVMQRLIEAAARDAGVNADEVVLERAEDTTWRDGSLGCPQPNMAYTQALVEGYWVVLHAGGEEFDMRVTRRGTFTRCQGSTKQPPIRYEDS